MLQQITLLTVVLFLMLIINIITLIRSYKRYDFKSVVISSLVIGIALTTLAVQLFPTLSKSSNKHSIEYTISPKEDYAE